MLMDDHVNQLETAEEKQPSSLLSGNVVLARDIPIILQDKPVTDKELVKVIAHLIKKLGGFFKELLLRIESNVQVEYRLDLMSNSTFGKQDQTIYLSANGEYSVRDFHGGIHKGLLPKNIILSDLNRRIHDASLKAQVLEFTAKKGHTPSPDLLSIHFHSVIFRRKNQTFEGVLGLSCLGVEERQPHFYISKSEALKNNDIIEELRRQRAVMQKTMLSKSEIEGLRPDIKDLIIATTVLNIIFPLPSHLEWEIYMDYICIFYHRYDDVRSMLRQYMVCDLGHLGEKFKQPYLKKIIENVSTTDYLGFVGLEKNSYYVPNDILIPLIEKIKEIEKVCNKKLPLECYDIQNSESGNFSGKVCTESMKSFIAESKIIENQILASVADFQAQSHVKISLEYLFFKQKSNSPEGKEAQNIKKTVHTVSKKTE